MNTVKVFQIYFKENQLHELDSNFIPYDNTSNLCPQLREYYVWNKIHNSELVNDVDYWGAVSWQFRKKANMTGEKFTRFAHYNPGYEVYYIGYYGRNVWIQGENYHPGISTIADTALNKLGYSVNCKSLAMPNSFFYNYFIASKNFWNQYMKFIEDFLKLCEHDSALNDSVHGLHLTHNGSPLSMFSFLVERFTPTFIQLNNISSALIK